MIGFGDAKPTLFRVSIAKGRRLSFLVKKNRAFAEREYINVERDAAATLTRSFQAYVPPHTRKKPSTGDTGLHLR